MTKIAPRWTSKQLILEAEKSAAAFRAERLAPSEAWKEHFTKAKQRFETLFEQLGQLAPGQISDSALASAYRLNLGDALRYLSGPPISDDDLQRLADVPTLAASSLSNDAAKLRKVFKVIEQTIDPYRFPWIIENRPPTRSERSAALLASSVLLAAQRIATARRGVGKGAQEALVKQFLTSLKYREVPRTAISTIVEGPRREEFCGESMLGRRKADVIVRLNDTRLMPIECKVSNSALNSVKRINNDAAAKAVDWLKSFGTNQVVPTAVISGVYKVANLMQAQEAGLTLFWAHDLKQLGKFIVSIRAK